MRLLDRGRRYLSGEPLLPIAALFALNAVDELDSRTFELLGPEIADHFGISVGRFGIIAALVVILAPLLSVPISYLADRRRRMPLAIAGAVAWAMFSLATPLAPGIWLLIAARVGSGFGKVVNEPVHGGLIADFYSPTARSKAFGLHALANPVGAAFASLVAGALAELWDWRLPFFVLTVPTVAAVALALRVGEPERGRYEVIEAGETPPLRDAVSTLWALRSLRLQWFGLAWANGAVFGIGVLVPFFLEEEFGLGPGRRGVVIGIGTAIAAGATIAGTAYVQRRVNEQPSAGLRIVAWAGIIAAGALLLASMAPTLAAFVAMLWLIVAIFGFVIPALLSVTSIVAPPELRSSAFALGGLVALSGLGFSIIGFAIGSASVRWALFVMSPIFLRGVLYFFQAARFLDGDVARLDPEIAARARHTTGEHSPVLLETRGVCVSYDGVQVLFGVDLEVRRGEIVALLGTNGAGKSTTLNAISGLVVPDAGNVFFEGRAITGEPPERSVRRGIVQVPGGRGLFPALSVDDNLRMGAFTLRHDPALVERRIGELFELFPRLAERRRQRAGDLSGGERQMLTLGQSFLLEPKLLMIDELSLGLAPAIVEELLAAVARMNERGASVILVEQSVNVALTLADRAYFLEKGEVRFEGRAADLLGRDDLLRSVFLEGAVTRHQR